jgi:hypothetical protein
MSTDDREERIQRNRELAKRLAEEIERREAEADPKWAAIWDAEQQWLASHRAERGLK